MPVRYRDWITREMVQGNPKELFVFGDNAARVGYGGQAKAMRGEPNAIGVATLYAPGKFYDNDTKALFHVAYDLAHVARELYFGRTVNVPRDGLGTGLARLIEHRPDLHNLIVALFKAADGEPCPWSFIDA